jgi:hypothetical protein
MTWEAEIVSWYAYEAQLREDEARRLGHPLPVWEEHEPVSLLDLFSGWFRRTPRSR